MRIVVEGKELWDILDWKYIFNWLFLHCHLSFRGCKLEDHESSTFLKPEHRWLRFEYDYSLKNRSVKMTVNVWCNGGSPHIIFPTSSVMSFLFAITSWWFKGLSIPGLISKQTAQPSLQSQTSENWRWQIWKIGKSKAKPWFYNQFSDVDAPIIFRNPPKTQLVPRDRLQISMYHPQLMGMG